MVNGVNRFGIVGQGIGELLAFRCTVTADGSHQCGDYSNHETLAHVTSRLPC